MGNIFEPNADLEGMLIPPAPHINVELGMGGDFGVRTVLSTRAPLLAISSNIKSGVRGASCAAGFGYILSMYGPPFAVIVAVACVIAIAMALAVMVGEVDAAVGQLASRQVGN